jgi:pyruvate,water dikinase
MSHAALVSREKKVPCIVGTKNATRILKEGDKIILDADN